MLVRGRNNISMKYPEIARRMAYVLNFKNITAQELCNLSGVSKASISQYVNGNHIPSNISSGKMAEVLGVNPVWLMGFDVPMQTDDKSLTSIVEAKIRQSALVDVSKNAKANDLVNKFTQLSPKNQLFVSQLVDTLLSQDLEQQK